jgi:tRNA(Ile)-lysidine synthase
VIPLEEGRHTAWLDRTRLEFPLIVGPWEPGDRMRPAGLGGSKLISDILTDAKVPSVSRKQCRVLRSGRTIVWLLGHRVAEGYAAGRDTAQVLKVVDLT